MTSAGPGATTAIPVAACDVASHLYSLSFAPNPDWTDRYSRTARDLALPPEVRGRLRPPAAPALRARGPVGGLGRERAPLAPRDVARTVDRLRPRRGRGRAQRARDPGHSRAEGVPGPNLPLRALGPRVRPGRPPRGRDRDGRVRGPVHPRDPAEGREAPPLPAHAGVGAAAAGRKGPVLAALALPALPGAAAPRAPRPSTCRARWACCSSGTRG